MYRFLLRPRWLAFHLLVVAAVVAMVNLGFWQLRRLDEKQSFNATVTERIEQPPAPLDDVLTPSADPDAIEWRTVTASGTYLPDETVRVVNRSLGGLAGDIVVTPLRLDDGRLLLVERGFVPLDEDAAAPPGGEVQLAGRLRPSDAHRRGQAGDPATGELDVVQRLDVERLAPQLPGDVVAMYVELVQSSPAEAGPYPQPLPLPELTEGPHLSYAVQWFIFSACAVVGWVLAVRRSATTRRAEPAGASGPLEAGHPAELLDDVR